MILLPLLACAASDAEPFVDSADPPPCMPGLGTVEICVPLAERHQVHIYGINGREGTMTYVDGPGCSAVYVEPGEWRVEAFLPSCIAQDDVLLQECGVVRVVFAQDDFACGDRG